MPPLLLRVAPVWRERNPPHGEPNEEGEGMTTEERRRLIIEWYEHMTAINLAWEGWRELGVNIEAPFPDAVWQAASAWTDQLEKTMGLGDMLSWFQWEKPMHGGKVEYEGGKSYMIVGLPDILDMFDAQYPLKKVKE